MKTATTPAPHSPLPWGTHGTHHIHSRGDLIIECLRGSKTTPIQSNAVHIVKCANAHPLLIEALKEVHGRMKRRYIEEEIRMGVKRPIERCEQLYQKITSLLASFQP